MQLRPWFGWILSEPSKKTFENTTPILLGSLVVLILQKHYKSPFPLNVKRRDEPVATDLVSPTLLLLTEAGPQIFVGMKSSLVIPLPEIRRNSSSTLLEDNIRERGAMSRLLSDRAQVEIPVHAFLAFAGVEHRSQWQSEPHQQDQSPL
jgi:hypothetical protein